MSKKVKRYIDQEEWISRLETELNETTNKERKTYLNIWINAIKCQPIMQAISLREVPQKKTKTMDMEFSKMCEVDGYNACIDEILLGGGEWWKH